MQAPNIFILKILLIFIGLSTVGGCATGADRKVPDDGWYYSPKLKNASKVLEQVKGYFLSSTPSGACTPSGRRKNSPREMAFIKEVTGAKVLRFKFFENDQHLEITLGDHKEPVRYGLVVELNNGDCQTFELDEIHQ